MPIYVLRLLQRNGEVASVQWVSVPTRPKWADRRVCCRKGSGNVGSGWKRKVEGSDAEQDNYCQERRRAGVQPPPKKPHCPRGSLDRQPSYLATQLPRTSRGVFRASAQGATAPFALTKSHKRLPLPSPPQRSRRRSWAPSSRDGFRFGRLPQRVCHLFLRER
jgi:hypothetical protein